MPVSRFCAGLKAGAWSFYVSDGHRLARTLSVATADPHVRLGDQPIDRKQAQ